MARVIDLFTPGAELAKGLGTGLQQLAQHKINEIAQQKQASGLQALFPSFNEKQATGLAQLPPQVQQQYIKSLLEGNQQGLFSKALGELTGESGQQTPEDILSRLSPKQAAEYTKIKQAQRRQESAEQDKLRPFLTKQAEFYKSERQVKNKAQENLDILRKHPEKFKKLSTLLLSKTPQFIHDYLQRDPDLRRYAANSSEIVTLRGQTRRGLPSKYKLTLEELAKANLSQPYETQVDLLENIVGSFDKEKDLQKYIHSLKDKKGNYPGDLPSLVTNFQIAQDDPLDYPEAFQEGTEYQDDDGNIFVLKNGTWELKNG